MEKISFLWGAGSLIFFKVAFDYVYGDNYGLSVSAAGLLGIMVAISVYVAHQPYNLKHFRSVWAITTIANVLVAKAIVFGFSKELNNAIGDDLLFDLDYPREVLTFIAFTVLPITTYYVSSLFVSQQVAQKSEVTPPILLPENILYKVWRGEKTLGFTFWVIFFVPCLLLNAILQADRREEIPLLVVLLGFAYYIYASVAAWRSARKHPTITLGSSIAIGVVAIGLVVNIGYILLVLFAMLRVM